MASALSPQWSHYGVLKSNIMYGKVASCSCIVSLIAANYALIQQHFTAHQLHVSTPFAGVYITPLPVLCSDVATLSINFWFGVTTMLYIFDAVAFMVTRSGLCQRAW